MGRPPKEVASPSTLAASLVRLLVSRGVSTATLGVPHVPVGEPIPDALAVTPTSMASLLRMTSELLADPHAGLRLPAELVVERYDAVTLALRAARTPREVLALVARYAPLIVPHLEGTITEEQAEVRLSTRVAGHPRGLGVHADEYILAFVLAHCRRGGSRVDPSRVWLACARPTAIAPLAAVVGSGDIVFGAEGTGLAFQSTVADLELPGADATMLATADHLAAEALSRAPRAGAFAATVGARIEALLPNDASSEAVAAALHMSARTLQRRLEDEGARFSDVLDAVRERMARDLVRDPALALAEVAFRVGFSDAATFSRAFKRWTGLPPGALRQRSK